MQWAQPHSILLTTPCDWPSIIALASAGLFPQFGQYTSVFPHIPAEMVKDDLAYPAMLTYLPAGLLGLVIASLIAAF